MTEQNSLSARVITLMAAAVVVVIGTFLLTPALPQDPGYHQFADTRSFLGIRNFGDVVSNLPFLIVGFMGLRYLRWHSVTVCPPGLHVSYVIFLRAYS